MLPENAHSLVCILLNKEHNSVQFFFKSLIYSANKFMIVSNVCAVYYYALPIEH